MKKLLKQWVMSDYFAPTYFLLVFVVLLAVGAVSWILGS